MKSTILICTRNQRASLARTLMSIEGLTLPAGIGLKLTIIDNGSTDDTPALLRQFAGKLPITVIGEEKPGLSIARNTGLAALDGDIVLCTDDDATVPADWLVNYVSAFHEHPGVSFMGGDVVPVLDGGNGAWARAAVKAAPSCFARFAVGNKNVPLDTQSPRRLLPFGVNMAFRVDALKQFRFDESLGRQPGGLTLSGEETALMADMIQAGHKGLLLAGNPVQHNIHASRQNVEFVRKYYFAQGWQAGRQIVERGSSATIPARLAAQCVTALTGALPGIGPNTAAGIWLERQNSHFSGRLKAFSEQTEAS